MQRTSRPDPDLIAVARGDAPGDIVLRGGNVVNVFTRSIERADVIIKGDRVAGVGSYNNATDIIDVSDAWVLPGFMDAHMHVESTMLLPAEFARTVLPHGTTAVVLDPHEIANVAGMAGITFLMDAAQGLPLNFLFAASSCVPSSPLETSGACLEAADLAPMFADPRVVALAEMMNFPGLVGGDPALLDKVRLGLSHAIVDGHCPGLSGAALQAYVAAGISSDHESTTAEEAIEKVKAGLRVFIREGSAARNLEALLPAVHATNCPDRFCFCTDDRHPGDLVEEGHVNHVVRKAISLGLDPATAIAMATLHPAQHFQRHDMGAVAAGYLADLQVVDDLTVLRPRLVMHHGRVVVMDGALHWTEAPAVPDDTHLRSSVSLPESLHRDVFRIEAKADTQRIRVIGADPYQLVTAEHRMSPLIEAGAYIADIARDMLKLAVIERHRGSGNIGLGFATGFGLKRGVLASTVGHDAHNLMMVGVDDHDLLLAAQTLERIGGGQCVVANGQVLAVLPLPIAGLLSDLPVESLIPQQRALHDASRSLGCVMDDPFTPLSFLPLPVIPALKLTDLGPVDVNQFRVVPLEVDDEP